MCLEKTAIPPHGLPLQLSLTRLNLGVAVAHNMQARRRHLQEDALLLALLRPDGQRSPGRVLKHLPHALICLCRALEVLLRANLLADVLGLCTC